MISSIKSIPLNTAAILIRLIVAISIIIVGGGAAAPGRDIDPVHGRASPAFRGDSAVHVSTDGDGIQLETYNRSGWNATCVAEWVSVRGEQGTLGSNHSICRQGKWEHW